MKKKKGVFEKIIFKILSKVNTQGGALVLICTIFGFGFGAGCYVSNIFHQIEVNDLNQNHYMELVRQEKDFEKSIDEFKSIITELKHKNSILEYNLNRLNHEDK